ncbi:MAG: MaoC family dehydratase N-terminal domain-containing protein [Thermodesulfobacteriota bacterium]|nr:MaoC family dehydratase N-terminal domain-containing protein [Thermodesulfobacteriota bacterium]
MSKLIGKSGEPMILAVERGAIRKFADAVGDRNPLIWDDEYARNSRYGSIVAPPGFFGWPVKWDSPMPFFSPIRGELIMASINAGYSRIVDGGIEYDFFHLCTCWGHPGCRGKNSGYLYTGNQGRDTCIFSNRDLIYKPAWYSGSISPPNPNQQIEDIINPAA